MVKGDIANFRISAWCFVSQLSRFAPPTQMDAFRALLRGYSGTDKGFESDFRRSLLALRQLACPELGRWLRRASTPAGLKRLIGATSSRLDWLEWDLHFFNLLRVEEDLSLFDEMAMRLGALGTRRAQGRLLKLRELCRDEGRREIVERELNLFASDEPFEALLLQVLLGEREPPRAQLAGRRLAALAGPEQLQELVGALPSGDALACHLLRRAIAFVPDPSVKDILLFLFQEALKEFKDSQKLEGFLAELKPLVRDGQRGLVLSHLRERVLLRAPDLSPVLEAALTEEGRRPAEALEPLRDWAQGPFESFLLESLGLLLEGKSATQAKLITDSANNIPALQTRFNQSLDDLAGLLADKVESGELPLDALLPVLEAARLAGTGGEDLLFAYLRLIPPDDKARLNQLLEEPDIPTRARCIEILGAREEDGLVPFFLRAVNDPEPAIEKLAVRQFGKLPSGLPAMMNLFRSEQPDRIRQAIHFFSENRAKAAAKPLMSFLTSEATDDLMVDAVLALGQIGNPATAPALLNQLHNGKPLAMQLALVEALTQLRTPAASNGLLKKAEQILFPQVIIEILEGTLIAFPSFDQPFPAEQLQPLEVLIERCCDQREGAGQWMRAALLLKGLHVFDAEVYERLKDRFNGYLEEMREKLTWDRESAEKILQLLKTFTRRAENLRNIEPREKALEAQLEAFPAEGPKRMAAILRLKQDLMDSDPIYTATFAIRFGAFLRNQLGKTPQDHYQRIQLIEIAGMAGQSSVVEPLRDMLAHEQKADIRRELVSALKALGLSDRDINKRPPLRSVLLFEPNAFHRNRLATAMEGGGRNIAVAATRDEANSLLAAKARDLLVCETRDASGDLTTWIEGQWDQHRFRYAVLSAGDHDPSVLADKPWIIGRLTKPYPLDELGGFFEE